MEDTTLGEKVRRLRKRRGLSQDALAQIAGLSLRTVQRIESENRNPSGDSLRRLSRALEVSPDFLLEWEPNENRVFLLILAASPLLCVINPFLAIIVPLVLWGLKRESVRGVKALGARVLKIEAVWIVVFYVFRTLNFVRLRLMMPSVIVGDEWERIEADIETQAYLIRFFVLINILIAIVLVYGTYRDTK